jgi:hypothetical protein
MCGSQWTNAACMGVLPHGHAATVGRLSLSLLFWFGFVRSRWWQELDAAATGWPDLDVEQQDETAFLEQQDFWADVTVVATFFAEQQQIPFDCPLPHRQLELIAPLAIIGWGTPSEVSK